MNRLLFGTILIIFTFSLSLNGQKSDERVVRPLNQVQVDFRHGVELVYPYNMVKGSSVYNLSKVFDIPTQKIFKYNNLKVDQIINIGDIIDIPLIKNNIVYSPPKGKHFVALTYKVKPKETLYHLAKRKMNMDVDRLKKINGLNSDEIREGGELILGWYVLEKTESKNQTVVYQTPIDLSESINKNSKVESPGNIHDPSLENEEETEGLEKLTYKRVIGCWDKNTQAKTGLYVLSNMAKQGSKIKLYFPMNRTSVTATVIGKIPSETYSDETEIFISPQVAQQLGIIDRRFSVETRYIEKKDIVSE
ncbi:MAG: LysM peptidoglycan-binding domain-containing protein [Saprospiraceae bacterium]